ncbi:MAG: aldo/keto reductase [Chloroflexota bacterium]|nr:aldo/keto reductase [Chloroflexota bacterium]
MIIVDNFDISPRPVGRTAITVSRLGFGAAPIGGLYTPVAEAQALETMRYALAHGITFFDTAPAYGGTLSETRVGAALSAFPRTTFTLATKAGVNRSEMDESSFDFSTDGILRSVEASLKRLRVDQIDIVHLHDPDQHFRAALDTAYPALHRLREQGVIGAIGAGMNQWEMLHAFTDHADFDCFLLAGRYTLLEQDALPLLETCQRRGIGLFLGGIYNGGILATGAVPGAKHNYRDAPPDIMARVRQIEQVCQRHQIPLRAAALHFAAAHPAVTAVIVGLRSMGEVDDAIAALHTTVPPDFWRALQAEALLSGDLSFLF